MEPQEFEFAGIVALRDIRIQIQELIHVAAVAGKIYHLAAGNRVTDGLILSIDSSGLRGDDDALLATGQFQYRVGAQHVATG